MVASAEILRLRIQSIVPLEDVDWELLLPYLELKTIKKNHFLIQEGEMGKELGIVLDGAMRHFYMKDGEEKTTYFYFENAFVGPFMSCLSGKPSQMSFEALTDTHLLMFPYKRLQEMYAISHTWERFGRLIAEWAVMGLEERMVGLLTLSPEERYIQLLKSNKKKIIERIPQHLIANYLGITPVSLSRIRNRVMGK